MGVAGRLDSEEPAEVNLSRCGAQEIVASNHLGHMLGVVVHDHGEVVGRCSVAATQHEVVDDAGVNFGFSHFDFFGMDDRDSGDKVWSDEKLSEFRVGWRKLWGAAESLDPTANSIVNLCERTGAPQAEARFVIVVPTEDASATGPEGCETWNTYNDYRGDIVLPAFHLKYTDDPADFEAFRQAHADGGPAALLGELIAGPD